MTDAEAPHGADTKTASTDFLDAPHEQIRHAVIAALIESYGPGEVWDLGSGGGHLLRWLSPRFATRYLALDMSERALARIAGSIVPFETIVGRVQDFSPPARPVGSLICSEVLYYLDDPGAELVRIARSLPSLGAMIVSCVDGGPDKPNWRKATADVARSLDAAGWTSIERIRVEAGARGLHWDIAVYRLAGAVALEFER